jgi:hypothetical protein
MNQAFTRLEELIAHINLTNAKTVSGDNATLTELLARVIALKQRVNMMRSFLGQPALRLTGTPRRK